MEFRVLGAVEVMDGGRLLPLGGRRPQAVVASLLVRPGAIRSTDRLIDDVWGSKPPAAAATTLRSMCSRLRAVVGDNRLLAVRGQGYRLALAGAELDAEAFEADADAGRQLLNQGETAAAVGVLDRALARWRGPAFAGFTEEPFARARAAALAERRLTAIEDRMEAALAAGHHQPVAAELEGLVLDLPLRERLWELLLVALYRSGRQADALRAYGLARERLLDELGIDPGPRLQRLETAILRQDEAVLGPAPADVSGMAGATTPVPPSTVPPLAGGSSPPGVPAARTGAPTGASTGSTPLIGREAEISRLLAAWERAAAGHGGLLVLLGEPGVGKSALSRHLGAAAGADGALVFGARCHDGAPVYWPWVQVLRQVADRDPGAGVRLLGADATVLGGLDARLGPASGVAFQPGDDAEASRVVVFDAVSRFIARLADERPLVLVLDDLQWADVPSLLLLRYLAPQLSTVPALAVAAYRDDEIGARPEAAAALAGLAREATAARVVLGGLPRAGVAQLLEASLGIPPDPSLVTSVIERTEGNPFFVAELGRLLGSQRSAQFADDRLPDGVRALVGERLSRLDPGAVGVLEAAAVAGRTANPSFLAAAVGRPVADVLTALDAAAATGLLEEGRGGELRFRHDLVREAVRDLTPPGRRAHTHLVVADALRASSPDLDADAEHLALHYVRALPAGAAAPAVEWSLRAASRALALLAHETAAAICRRVLSAIGDGRAVAPAARADLLLTLGEAEARSGDRAAARRAYEQAAACARLAGDGERLAAAALGFGSAGVTTGAIDNELVGLLDEAVAATPAADPARRAHLLARLGMERYYADDPEASVAVVEDAVAEARRAGDPYCLGDSLAALHYVLRGPDGLHRRRGVTAELGLLAQSNVQLKLAHLRAQVADLLEVGERDEADRAIADYEALVAGLRQPAHDFQVRCWRALQALLDGRFSDGEQLAAEALAAGERALPGTAFQSFGVQLALLRREQHRHAELLPTVEAYVAEVGGAPAWECGLAVIEVEAGLVASAWPRLTRLVPEDGLAIPRDVNWMPAVAMLSVTAARLGDAGRCAMLYDALTPYAGQVVVVGGAAATAVYGAVDLYLGMLAGTTGQFDQALTHLADARRCHLALASPPWVGHTDLELGRWLAAAGRTDEAAVHLDQAEAAADELGMAHLASLVQAQRREPRPAVTGH